MSSPRVPGLIQIKRWTALPTRTLEVDGAEVSMEFQISTLAKPQAQ
jgi:hypothetical protein